MTDTETEPLNPAHLWESLLEENNFVMKIVDSIPAAMYFNQGIQEKITAEKHAVMDKVAEDVKRKTLKHTELSEKNKHKRARMDPFHQKSVSQIQNEISKRKRKRKHKGLLASDSITRAANIEELQKRLQEKISMLQAQRKAVGKDSVKMNRLKNKVKKLKVRQKGNLRKFEEIEKKTNTQNGDLTHEQNAKKSKPVYNKDCNILYSKFEFGEDGEKEKKKNEFAGKKVKQLLKDAEKKQENIQNLKSSDPEKAELLMEKDKWKKAIQKTEGIKVKDDQKLLKKTLKRKEKRKKKSAKAWNERAQDVEKKKKERQEKRAKNIQKRKQEKRDRKIKLAKKKGRVVLKS